MVQTSKENEQLQQQYEKLFKRLKQNLLKRDHSSELESSACNRKQSDNRDENSYPLDTEGDNVTDGERAIGQQRGEIVRFEHYLRNMAELLDLTARAPRK